MTAPTIAPPGGETGAQPPPPARAESGTTAARAAIMLHDHDPHQVVEQLLHELDEARAGTHTLQYGVEYPPHSHLLGETIIHTYPAADRPLAVAEARRRGVELQLRFVRRGPWRPAT